MKEFAAGADDGAEAAGLGAAGFAPDEVEGGGGGGGVVLYGADFAGGAADLEGEARADDLQAAVAAGEGFAAVVDRQDAPFAFEHGMGKERGGGVGEGKSLRDPGRGCRLGAGG